MTWLHNGVFRVLQVQHRDPRQRRELLVALIRVTRERYIRVVDTLTVIRTGYSREPEYGVLVLGPGDKVNGDQELYIAEFLLNDGTTTTRFSGSDSARKALEAFAERVNGGKPDEDTGLTRLPGVTG